MRNRGKPWVAVGNKTPGHTPFRLVVTPANLDWGSRGRRFKSGQPDETNPLHRGLSRECAGVLAFCGGLVDHGRMVNVRTVERDQLLLMPPSLSDWLPSEHLAWLIVDVVAELDLSGFYRLLRADGRGGTSYDPGVMLGVLLYAYCVGEHRAAGSSSVSVTMSPFGWLPRISNRTMPRWLGSGVAIRRLSLRCSARGWGCVLLRVWSTLG